MKSNELDREKLEKLHSYLNIPLTYKQICDISGFSYQEGQSKVVFLDRLSRWCLYEKTTSPTRFILKEFYKEPLEFLPTITKLSNDKAKYNEAEIFFAKRKLSHPDALPHPLRNRQKISFVCNFHPHIVQTNSWIQLRNSIGCPLCKYQSSRFETMIYLGIDNAQRRVKFDGVEFDIYIPSISTVVEIDGCIYHKDDTPDQLERKEQAAKNNGLKFLKVAEILDAERIGVENNISYVVPFSTASKKLRKQIINILSDFIPFKYQEDLWDKAADFMREEKQTAYESSLEKISENTILNQYDQEGTLLNTYTISELLKELHFGSAFGYKWSFEKSTLNNYK